MLRRSLIGDFRYLCLVVQHSDTGEHALPAQFPMYVRFGFDPGSDLLVKSSVKAECGLAMQAG